MNTVASGQSSYVDFTLDGEVISPTQIQETITTPVTQISGNFTQTSATQLANALNFGALPLAFTTGTVHDGERRAGLAVPSARA